MNHISNIAQSLSRVIKQSGGFTYSPVTGHPTKGFACAIDPHNSIAVQGRARAEEIDFFLNKFNSRLNTEDHLYFGAWYDASTDLTWLELSKVYRELPSALNKARETNQDFVYDFASGSCVKVK